MYLIKVKLKTGDNVREENFFYGNPEDFNPVTFDSLNYVKSQIEDFNQQRQGIPGYIPTEVLEVISLNEIPEDEEAKKDEIEEGDGENETAEFTHADLNLIKLHLRDLVSDLENETYLEDAKSDWEETKGKIDNIFEIEN